MLALGLFLAILADTGKETRSSNLKAQSRLTKLGASVKSYSLHRFLLGDEPNLVPRKDYVGVSIGNDWRGGKEQLSLLKEVVNLKEVCIGGEKVTDDWLAIFEELPQLEAIFLDGYQITDKGFRHLRGQTSLIACGISLTSCTDASCRYLARMPKLRYIIMSGAKVGNNGLKALRVLNNLEVLLADATYIDKAGVKYLKDLPRLRRLRTSGGVVVPNMNRLTFKDFPSPKFLEKLEADGLHVTDADLRKVATMQKLEWLSLGFNPITDKGLRHLGTLRVLRYLRLDGTSITSSGLQYVTGMTKLEHLDISFTAVNDSAIPHLLKLPSLRTIAVAGTKITEAGKNELKKKQIKVRD